MGTGLDMVQRIADMVAHLPGATQAIATPHLASFTLIVLGGLWLCLWQRTWRAFGLAMIAAGLLAVPDQPRPDILVERSGKAVAVRGADHVLALVGKSPVNFGTKKWFSADGDGRLADDLKATRTRQCDGLGCITPARGGLVAFAQHPAALEQDCGNAHILIARFNVGRDCRVPIIIDRLDLWARGAHAIYFTAGKPRIETVSGARGQRPWVRGRPLKRRGRYLAARAPAPTEGL